MNMFVIVARIDLVALKGLPEQVYFLSEETPHTAPKGGRHVGAQQGKTWSLEWS
jgi:hypothetical protein